MASRTVAVTLTAQVTGYLANLRAAEQATRELESRTRTADQALRDQQETLRKHHAALEATGKGFLAVGATAAAGLALAVHASSEYGARMAQLQSLTHSGARDMQTLSDAAMTQGKAFGYSATQVADAQIELAKAGVTVKEQLGGALQGTLALAAAGQMDVAQATTIAATTLTQFGLSGKDIPHVADVLASAADKSVASVQSIGDSLQQSGGVAASFGISLDDTVGTLTAFSKASLNGSDGGTSFKTMLTQLARPTEQAQAVLGKYNISAYDAQGHFVGMTALADQLRGGLHKLSDEQRNAALVTIFGNDAYRAANALYDLGGTKLQGYIDANREVGFASTQAAGKLNSLQGDVQKLGAAFETDLIKAGQQSDGVLRNMTQSATGLLGAVGDLPAPVQTGATVMLGLVAATGLAGGAMLLAVPKMAAFRTGLTAMNLTGRQAGAIFGVGSALLVGIGMVSAGFAAMGQHGTASAQQVAQAGHAIEEGWGNLDKTFAHAGNAINAGSGLAAALDELGNGDAATTKWLDGITGGISHLGDVYKSNEQTLDAMGQQLAALAQQDYGRASQSFAGLVSRYKLGAAATRTLLENMPAYRDELAKQAEAAHVTASTTNLVNIAQGKGAVSAKVAAAAAEVAAAAASRQAEGLARLRGQAGGAKKGLDDLEKAIEGFGSATLDARGAQSAMRQAIADATKTVGAHGRGLNLATQAGRDNDEALRGIASAAAAASAKTLHMTGSTKAAAHELGVGREGFIKAAAAAGIVGDKAQRLADKYGLIPKNVTTAVGVTGFDAAAGKAGALTKAGKDFAKRYEAHLLAEGHLATEAHKTAMTEAAKWEKRKATAKIDADPQPAIDAAKRAQTAIDAVHGVKVPISSTSGFAAGGAVTGAGSKGIDSVPAMLAPGEHVLTTSDVDRLGGQGGAYAFRAALANGEVGGYAKGGAPKRKKGPSSAALALAGAQWGGRVYAKRGKIVRESDVARQDRIGKGAAHEVTRDAAAIRTAKAAAKRAAAAEKAAQKRYDAIDGTKANRAAKRRAGSALKTAKARSTAADKRATAAETERDKDTARRDAAKASALQLRRDREDFVSAERRDPTRRSTDPLAYVDQLRSMSRDENYSAGRRKKFDDAANQYEKTLVTLSKTHEAAAKKLDTLKDSAVALHDSIASAVTGGYRASSAGSTPTASGWVTRNGMRFRSYTTGPSAAGLATYYTQGASAAKKFADDLARLTKRGYPDALVSEVAGYGVEQGQPIVTALLAAKPSEQAAISRGYTAIGSAGNRAGNTIRDDTYKEQIAAAKADADAIQATITADGEKLRKLIATAFGLKGYASGTTSATAGVHLVGEQGPELVGFAGGEWVANANDTARWVRGMSGGGGGGGGQPVTVQVPAFPDTITVQDASGFRATMRVVATEVVSQRNDQIAVGLMGASV